MAETRRAMEEIKKWVNELGNVVDSRMNIVPMEMEHWKKRSIYELPAIVTLLKRTAYVPHVVSFGPYHHGKYNLMKMKEHKHRALLHFVKRSNIPSELLVSRLDEILVQELKDSYDSLHPMWQEDTNRFLQMMILDGCFMWEILRCAVIDNWDDYAPNDPIFSRHGMLYMMPYIRHDMLLLENQLPMSLLYKLVAVECPAYQHNEIVEFVNRLVLQFCSPGTRPVSSIDKSFHVLDVYRKMLLWEDTHHPRRPVASYEGEIAMIPSATELNEAGIKFKRSTTASSLKDISFHGGVLRLPLIVVNEETESMFLNLIAFERFHVDAGNEVTSYVFLMDNLMRNSSDVGLLVSQGIIQNYKISDDEVPKVFRSICEDIILDPDNRLRVVYHNVNDHCKKPWNKWRAYLNRNYFRNPWAIVSVIVTNILFILTLAQTIYTVKPYYSHH